MWSRKKSITAQLFYELYVSLSGTPFNGIFIRYEFSLKQDGMKNDGKYDKN